MSKDTLKPELIIIAGPNGSGKSTLASVLAGNSKFTVTEGEVLTLIDEALKRLEQGEYGKCQECGERIPDGRLKVRPYAIFCVKCKSKHEEMMRG